MTNTATAEVAIYRNPLADALDTFPAGSLIPVCVAVIVGLGVIWFFRHRNSN